MSLSRRLEMSPSKVLIPLSYASIFGGTLTLVNILDWGADGFLFLSVGKVLGDMLVRMPSATAPAVHREPFDIETHHFGGVHHLEVQR